MKLSVLRSKTGFLALAVILVLAVGGAVLLAQKPSARTIMTLDDDRSYLGIEMEEVTADNMGTYKLSTERGVIVRSVEEESPAEAAGLMEKDVILEYAGMPVYSAVQLTRLVWETPPGRKVDLTVSRDGKKLSLTAKIGEREGPWMLRDGRKSMVIPGPNSEGEFRFEGPSGRVFRFKGPGGGPFAFNLPGGDSFWDGKDRPKLGITLQNLTDQMAEHLGVPGKKGVLVTAVSQGSPAAAANIKAGDVIFRADEKTIEDPEDLMQLVQRKSSGEKIELKIIRDKREMTVAVELPKKEVKKTGGYRL